MCADGYFNFSRLHTCGCCGCIVSLEDLFSSERVSYPNSDDVVF